MTPQNLMDYVKVYENFLDEETCKGAIQEVQNIDWQMHSFYRSGVGDYVRFDNELDIGYSLGEYGKKVQGKIWFAIEQYIVKDMAFCDTWYNSWNGYSQVRFNKYDETTKMKLHCDHIHSLFDGQRKGVPVLTVLGALNNDYEGGEFMMFGDQKVDMPAGSVIVFPSNFMYPHEVKPVKSGTRYSFVSWVW